MHYAHLWTKICALVTCEGEMKKFMKMKTINSQKPIFVVMWDKFFCTVFVKFYCEVIWKSVIKLGTIAEWNLTQRIFLHFVQQLNRCDLVFKKQMNVGRFAQDLHTNKCVLRLFWLIFSARVAHLRKKYLTGNALHEKMKLQI